VTTGAFRFLADAATFAASLSKAALLTVAADLRTEGVGAEAAARALRAARREAAGVASISSAARLRGCIPALLAIQREDRSRKNLEKGSRENGRENK
jgi:hypothetical protein